MKAVHEPNKHQIPTEADDRDGDLQSWGRVRVRVARKPGGVDCTGRNWRRVTIQALRSP